MDILTWTWVVIDVACAGIVLGAKFKHHLPGLLQDLFVHGKTRVDHRNTDSHWLREIFLVPNRWFTHFYAVGLVWNVFLLVSTVQALHQHQTNWGILKFIHVLVGDQSFSSCDCFSILLTLVLLTIQLMRRLYECLFVSSFSGKMHVAHYMTGIGFYVLVNLTVVAELPKFPSHGWFYTCLKPCHLLSPFHIIAEFLFLWASYHQYKCHTILGKLTTWTPNGTKIYKIPHGDWFEHVTSPHYLAEILIYLALFFTMKCQSVRWLLVLVFVIGNLTLSAHTTHLWYKRKFDNYPKKRVIMVPCLY